MSKSRTEPMDLLILGGTIFLGRHLTEAALAAGHRVTHFNRARFAPDGVAGVETIVGDRDGGLDALAGRRWDAVVDTCGYVPRLVGDSARALADVVDHYTFVSSISVYGDAFANNPETSAVATIDDETTEVVDNDTYGALKALCESAADRGFGRAALHVRAGLIVGPDDRTDRFAYWPMRVARGGDVLAPGRRDANVQFIDVRDLSTWILHAITHDLTGPFNVTGPTESLTMETLLETCRDTLNPDARLVWVDDAHLKAHDVAPWVGLPLWIPGEDQVVDISRAAENRLWTRPLADTVRDTYEWARSRPAASTFQRTLAPDRERDVLAAWRG